VKADERKTKRNRDILHRALNGVSFSYLAREHDMTITAVRRVVLRDCREIDRDLYISGIVGRQCEPTIRFLMDNKEVFDSDNN